MNPDECRLLDGLVELLEIFNVFSTFVQANNYPTLNTFVLFYTEIKDRLSKICTVYEDEDDVIAKTADILLDNLDKRLPLNEEHIGAAMLDPRMQHLPMIEEWLREKGIEPMTYIRFINLLI